MVSGASSPAPQGSLPLLIVTSDSAISSGVTSVPVAPAAAAAAAAVTSAAAATMVAAEAAAAVLAALAGTVLAAATARHGAGFLRLPALGLGQQRLAREADLARGVDVDHLHQDLVAFLDLGAHVLHVVIGHLRHVQEAVGAGQDLHERAEVDHPHHLAQVGLVQLGGGRQLLDDGDGLARGRLVHRGDRHAAVVLHVDLAAGALDDGADHLPAGADEV